MQEQGAPSRLMGTASKLLSVSGRAESFMDQSEDCFFRALLKDLKKATKEKQRLLKSSDKER